MIKLFLCLLLSACAIYGWRERRLSPMIGYLTPFLAAVGIALVLYPEAANRIADQAGVGRGADLVFYVWTVLSALLIANVHFRLRAQKELLTHLTRELALLNAERGRPTPP